MIHTYTLILQEIGYRDKWHVGEYNTNNLTHKKGARFQDGSTQQRI